ncbi:LLM class F420-dependent oxidoreductase [Rhodococcus sp. BP-349]|uniref:LLM class F420-dependent oxidoreductase n=1 Tax=unclassified Rhodococcus (in: high G+C Gram-positive bacteria) TaxID=192944 RepID=UPI001C9AAD55|nr:MULTISPECIES: LLM class F420-dependent oxidoreductase [unclassified Rhodococcus (in: high G+C Gram-positive bacteria)]MBY6541323.1 LLM class F420-dependent oxidoreductase [Rhodococcus sp. BP-363]MBY6544651.1 LLM class F420-dependent oxidoreductase [Rhodococcus sp. BP-369]MBY6563881.1 LLM class F420-dependent oxidoreductase [Rhodococcus sp. BP-370]MBY6579182.1 LLM class F420-dependent oxidoreductase [Rhodococcus sp. BP-364]MBY6588483.1 LLM class F420-dependent oxidoreductase [Rhodococcus sp.
MQLAVHYPYFTLPGGPTATAGLLSDSARAAEDGGCTLFTLMDHWFQMENLATAQDPMLEGYTSLGFLAGRTESIRLGLLVTGVTYRHPGLLAKTVTTLDVLSGGRAMLGIGAAWYEREHRGLGVPFPSTSERFERLEETLRICRQMWSDDDGPFEGTHYSLAETLCEPRPLQNPGPPIMVGGSGEKKTLAFVARYASLCNLFAPDQETVAHKLDVLRGHCERENRDYAEIEKTIITSLDPVADEAGFLREMEGFAALGVDTVCVSPQGQDPVTWTRSATAAVVDTLAGLEN